MRNQPCGAVVYGIDLGKTCFHVVGRDAAGHVIQRGKFTRVTIFRFFGNASAALIGMEACRITVACTEAPDAGTHRQDHAGAVRKAIR